MKNRLKKSAASAAMKKASKPMMGRGGSKIKLRKYQETPSETGPVDMSDAQNKANTEFSSLSESQRRNPFYQKMYYQGPYSYKSVQDANSLTTKAQRQNDFQNFVTQSNKLPESKKGGSTKGKPMMKASSMKSKSSKKK